MSDPHTHCVLALGTVQIQVERLQGLFDWREWVVRCSITIDENSFVEELSFIILDAH